jgi:hypothetical protein
MRIMLDMRCMTTVFSMSLLICRLERRIKMRLKTAIFRIILSSIFIWISASYLPAAEIYTWTDKDGNLHITKSPPPKGAKLREVTPYTSKTETEVSDSQEPETGEITDRESKEAAEAQRKADVAAKKAEEANIKASKAVQKAFDTRYKEATQDRQQRQNRVTEDDVMKAESEAAQAEAEAKKAWEEAQKAREKAQEAQERVKE